MSGLIGVEEQVDKDFHRALLKASLHRWRDRLRMDSAHERLLSFDEASESRYTAVVTEFSDEHRCARRLVS